MSVCKPICVTAIPVNDWVNGCNVKVRNGGVSRLLFLKCDPTVVYPAPPISPSTSPFSNPLNITYALCEGILFVTGPILGQKPKGSFAKKRLASCAPESVISGSKTIAFQDFNAEDAALLDFKFWDAINKNKKFMLFGWVTCDERVYLHDGDWDLEIDEVIEDSKEGNSFYDGTVTMTSKDLIVPFFSIGILDALESFVFADCV